MTIEVMGLDHLYLSVRDLQRSQDFHDRVADVLGFRKRTGEMSGEPHAHYFNRHLQYTLRPARRDTPYHDPYAAGLHHVCLRVLDESVVDRAARELQNASIETTAPRYYTEYAPDYYAIFFNDPDGIRFEITNFRESRRRTMYDWDAI